MSVYLAARYSRRLELHTYREDLRAIGCTVQARWLDGGHQIGPSGAAIGETGENLVENGGAEAASLRAHFAEDDLEDVLDAALVISFTEAPEHAVKRGRGGRHVELGIALASKNAPRVIVVGHRENIFHWLPQIEFFPTWPEALLALSGASQSLITSAATSEHLAE